MKQSRWTQRKFCGLHSLGGRLDGPGIIVKRAAKLAGLDKRLYPHALRAACLTHMLRNSKEVGQNIPRPLMEMAGHANLGTLHGYTATDIQELKEIHAKSHPRELEADF